MEVRVEKEVVSQPLYTIKRQMTVAWGDCDPAGIVYYPRYFEFFDANTNAMLAEALGMNKPVILRHYRVAGWPMVDSRAKFTVPVSYCEEITIETDLLRLGRSSFSLAHRIVKSSGELAVEGIEKRILIGRDENDPHKIHSVPIPVDMAEKLGAGAMELPQ
jgi:4-hydroxybenzoyl-CoA thioesterase